ncbi:hypothetical protein [Kribbella swartbergensis]
MSLGLLLWSIALVLTIWGLISAVRERLFLAAILIPTGLTLGLVSSTHLD